MVGGRRLASEKERPRRHIEVRIFAKAIIENDDPQRIEQLSLVFMDALDLAVKDCVGVDRLARSRFQPFGKIYLRLALGLVECLAKALVVGKTA